MKNSFFLLILCAICIAASCQRTENTGDANSSVTVENELNPRSEKEILRRIDKTEAKLRKAKDIKDEMPAARELVKMSEAFGQDFPTNKRSADVIFKAADVARGIGEYGKAVQLWGKVWRNYPDYGRAPDAVFMQAFTFENNLNDLENAKKYYRKVIENYPEHPLREQSVTALKNLGKSPEELIKEFQKGE